MALKIPPPPQFAGPQWQQFNRWLLEFQSILNGAGGIDPTTVVGLVALAAQVATNVAQIAALQTTVGTHTTQIAALQTTVGTHTTQITALQGNAVVHSGTGAPAGGLGNVNDWYGNVAGAVGARIYIKTAPGVWTAFPF